MLCVEIIGIKWKVIIGKQEAMCGKSSESGDLLLSDHKDTIYE